MRQRHAPNGNEKTISQIGSAARPDLESAACAGDQVPGCVLLPNHSPTVRSRGEFGECWIVPLTTRLSTTAAVQSPRQRWQSHQVRHSDQRPGRDCSAGSLWPETLHDSRMRPRPHDARITQRTHRTEVCSETLRHSANQIRARSVVTTRAPSLKYVCDQVAVVVLPLVPATTTDPPFSRSPTLLRMLGREIRDRPAPRCHRPARSGATTGRQCSAATAALIAHDGFLQVPYSCPRRSHCHHCRSLKVGGGDF